MPGTSRTLRAVLERRPEMMLAALRQHYPAVSITGSGETFLQATWREAWRDGTREVVVTAVGGPGDLAVKLRRPGWQPPG